MGAMSLQDLYTIHEPDSALTHADLPEIEHLEVLFCGRCETVRIQLRREWDQFDKVAIRRTSAGSTGGSIHLISRFNRKSLCGYHERVK